MAEKGSVAIDGISLTIAKSAGTEITLAVIPTTLASTTLALKRTGDPVNIECDVIARYIYTMLHGTPAKPGKAQGGETLIERMERSGF